MIYAQGKDSLKKSLLRNLMEVGKGKKGKFSLVHTMEAFRRSRDVAPFILIFGISPLYFQETTPT